MYARTLRENILYGIENLQQQHSNTQVVEAATLANAHGFITELKDGYETGKMEGSTSITRRSDISE